MRAVQSRNRPSTSLRFLGCVIVNRRSLDVAGRYMIPACEFDRIVEPIDPQFRKSIFELRESDGIAGQDIDADARSALRITGEPPRPDWKSSGGVGQISDEFAQRGPDG